MNRRSPQQQIEDGPAAGLVGLAERRLLPDALIRLGIRAACRRRLQQERAGGSDAQQARHRQRLDALRHSPVAIHTDAANAQHYELPPEFFRLCLGPRLKYSCCYYPNGNESLAEAEVAMLKLYCERARLADGQDILELGCGWGSLTLWMAERYPASRIVAVSNSALQRRHIENECRQRGLANVDVLTVDVNILELEPARFDRCVSVEMFEHLRNYDSLMQRIASWLRPHGELFVHIFAHQKLLYSFETDGDDNWMGQHFFTGGQMPSVDTLFWFQHPMRVDASWQISGDHYRRSAEHWLANQDARSREVLAVLQRAYGERLAGLWFQRWRMFWMACAELFGYRGGTEWLVAHYRFVKP